MNYQTLSSQHTSSSHIILEQTTSLQSVLYRLTRYIGYFLCILSLCIWMFSWQTFFFNLPLLSILKKQDIHTSYPNLWPFIFFGLGAFSLALSHLFREHLRMPQRFIFDNDAMQLHIESSSTLYTTETHLEYGEIQDFQVRRISTPHSTGRSIAYLVEMIKKDGAFWCMYSASSREEADDFCSRLQRHIPRQKQRPTRQTQEVTSFGKIRVEEGELSTCITWREYIHIRRMWTLVLLGISGLLFFLSVRSEPIASWGYILSISLVMLLLLIGFGYLQFLHYTHTIEITEHETCYRPFAQSEDVQVGFCIPHADIDTILFNFSLSHKAPTLYLLKTGETQALLKLKRGQDGPVQPSTLPRILRNMHTIDTHELNFAEQLHLENIIQEAIHRRSGHRVA